MTTDGSSPRDDIAFLARRAGWGLAPGRLDELEALGVEAVVDLLVDPTAAGVAEEPGPWDDLDLAYDYEDPQERRSQALAVLDGWIRHHIETERPYENTFAWFWHDHFAVSYSVVNTLPVFAAHIDLLRSSALGDYRELIRDVTTDAAMLLFLDGTTSTGDAPNENYGRELLELYTLGIGNYGEDDVRAAAIALTGWVVARRLDYRTVFRPERHDDTPQTFLGVDGVHDVDTVVDAAVDHPAVPGFIAAKAAHHFLGDVDQAAVARIADAFASSGLDSRALARSILEEGLAGACTPQITAPVPWFVGAVKATGAELGIRATLGLLRQMGQTPGLPPNVGGYPGAATWLASSSTAGRFSAANTIARATPGDAPALVAAADRDYARLADLLLRPAGFAPTTIAALDDLSHDAAPRRGEAVLAIALASPDLLVR
ncbi:MAG: DUF1800 domain-containing protein [Actinomycetota bacterium]